MLDGGCWILDELRESRELPLVALIIDHLFSDLNDLHVSQKTRVGHAPIFASAHRCA